MSVMERVLRFGSKRDLHNNHNSPSQAGSQHEGGEGSKSCTIRLLDDQDVLQATYTKEDRGQALLDFTFQSLNIQERDYFGLRYVDRDGQRNWLDATRAIHKQLKGVNPVMFCFRVKFYPASPSTLREEVTRHAIYMQLRRDLAHGRLYVTGEDAAQLMAFIVQSEIGDYDPNEHADSNYITHLKLALSQTPKLEDRIMELHRAPPFRGMPASKAQSAFLRRTAALDTYGIDPHPVKDHKGVQLYVGVNHNGIISFQGNRKAHHFKWSDIKKITYEGRMFIVHYIQGDKKHLFGFKCPTSGACHYLWRCAVEQRYFFTMNSASEIPVVTTGGGLFSRGCKLRYSGRTQREIFRDTIRQRQSVASMGVATGLNNGTSNRDDDDDELRNETGIGRTESLDDNYNPDSRRISGATGTGTGTGTAGRIPRSMSDHQHIVKSPSGQSYSQQQMAMAQQQHQQQQQEMQYRRQRQAATNGVIRQKDLDGQCAASEDGGRPQSQASRSFSITSAPPAVARQMGRSNTAPLPCESPDRSLYQENVVPYLNYSSYSEPYSMNNQHFHPGAAVGLAAAAGGTGTGHGLYPFDEDLELEMSSNGIPGTVSGRSDIAYHPHSSHHVLPTEFDLRPDITPTGDEDSPVGGRPDLSSPDSNHLNLNHRHLYNQHLNAVQNHAHQYLNYPFQTPELTISPSHHIRPNFAHSRSSRSSLATGDEDEDEDPDRARTASKSGSGSLRRRSRSSRNARSSHSNSNTNLPVNGDADRKSSDRNGLNTTTTATSGRPNKRTTSSRGRSLPIAILRTTLISGLLLVVFIATLCLLIYELDSETTRWLRDATPEMIYIHESIYRPARDFLTGSSSSVATTAAGAAEAAGVGAADQ